VDLLADCHPPTRKQKLGRELEAIPVECTESEAIRKLYVLGYAVALIGVAAGSPALRAGLGNWLARWAVFWRFAATTNR